MDFKISMANQEIPQVLNGVSANTMFYLINKEHLDNLWNDAVFVRNKSHIDMPFDIDDFSRCYSAYRTFVWTQEDFNTAIKNCELMKLERHFSEFFRNFAKLADLYRNGEVNQMIELNKLMGEIFKDGFWK